MHASVEETKLARPSAVFVGGTALVLAALWALDLFVLRTKLLAPWRGAPALVPLYAFWSPSAGPRALIFASAAFAFVVLAVRASDPRRVRRGVFVALLFAAALVMPFLLFLVRQDPSQLGREFVYYQNDEFYFDARRIADLGDFLAHYVEVMPQLSLHGQHFPPGHAALLYLVGQVFGTGTLPAGLTCLVCFSLAIVFAYFALVELARENELARLSNPESSAAESTVFERRSAETSATRQGALLLLASPSMLDFACTSMDAVFLMFAAIAWWIGLRAFGARGRSRDAIATGAALCVATCFSFSSLPCGLALGLYALLSGRAHMRQTLTRVAIVGASYIGSALLTDFFTGFSISACLFTAHAAALEFMTHAAGRAPRELWPELSFGNALAFSIGAGLAIVPAAATGMASAWRRIRPWNMTALATLGVMSLGGIYFLETERIWLFAVPWLAAVAVSRGAFAPATLRLLLAAGFTQALAMEVMLFTLW